MTVSGMAGRRFEAGVLAAAYVSALGNLISNVMPLLLGALADRYGLPDGALGQLNAAFIAATMVTGLTAPYWVPRFDWRIANYVATAGAVAALVIGTGAATIAALLILFTALGLFLGTLALTSFAALGETRFPNRSYATGVTIQSLLAAVANMGISVVLLPYWGVSGIWLGLALLIASGAVATRHHPRCGVAAPAPALDHSTPRGHVFTLAALPAMLTLFSIALVIGGIQGYWAFVERIGVGHGLAAEAVAATLSLCAVASIVNSAVVAWIGDRVQALTIIIAGTAIVNLSFFLLSFPGIVPFVASNILFASAFGLLVPSYWAVLKRVDATDRLFVAGPAAASAGAVAVSLIAGTVIGAGGYVGLTIFDGALTIVAALLAAVAGAAMRGKRMPCEGEGGEEQPA
jgi:hypothetical protein